MGAPSFIAAIGEIVEDRRRDHRRRRNTRLRNEGKALGLSAHLCGDAVGSGEAIDRAAREHERVNRINQVFRRERIGFARAWPAAPHIRRTHGALIGNDDRDAGAGRLILRAADGDAGDIGEGVHWARGGHRTWLRRKCAPAQALAPHPQRISGVMRGRGSSAEGGSVSSSASPATW